MDREAWRAVIHGVAKSWTRLSDWTEMRGSLGFLDGASGKKKKKQNLPANAGDIRDVSSIPGSGRSPGGGHGIPLHYSCLENPMDRVAWCAVVHTVAKSRTQLKQLSTHTKSFRQGSDQLYFTNIISTSYFTNISTSYFINISTNLWNRLIGSKIWHRLSGEKTFAVIQVRDNGGLIRWGREENGWAISEIINSS